MDQTSSIQIKDVIMIGAVILAPIFAVQVQKYLEKLREKRDRKLNLFFVLMSTRASRVSPEHVQALNMIDMEFYGKTHFGKRFQSKKDKEVQKVWKEYLDHLNSHFDDSALSTWAQKKDDLFVKLLNHISKALNFEFDNVDIKNGIYLPIAFGDQETDFLKIRQSLAKILSGEKPLPMKLEQLPVTEEELKAQIRLRELMIEFFEGKKNIPVEIINK